MNFKEKFIKFVALSPRESGHLWTTCKTCRKPKAARAVGVFMKNNPDAPIVPCHRVVAQTENSQDTLELVELIKRKKCSLLKVYLSSTPASISLFQGGEIISALYFRLIFV